MKISGKEASFDRWFLFGVGLWLAFGLIMLASASAPLGFTRFNSSYFFLKRQILYGLLPGAILFFLAITFPLDLLKKISWWIYGLSLALLVLVFIPGIGTIINGSRSWVSLGFASFQPSEFAKAALIIIAASLFGEPGREAAYARKPWLGLAALAPACLLVLAQPDIGTLSIFAVVIFIILFVAGVPVKYLIGIGGAVLVFFGFLVALAPYRLERLSIFLHPELDPKGVGYHINQAFLAIGSGGITGLGFGESRQKFQYLPEVNADSIFAVIAEEQGFLISAAFLILILVVGWRGLKIAKNASTSFERLLVVGLVGWIIWQSFLNIGAMVGILPLTGVPLPFVSHGGSALLSTLAAAGFILNVSRRRAPQHL